VREHVELAYATTAYGAQGTTVPIAHVSIGDHTGASSAYVGMTRGHENNTAHLVADTLDDARRQWIDVFGRDRADLGPTHAAKLAAEAVERYGPTARPAPYVPRHHGRTLTPAEQERREVERRRRQAEALEPSPRSRASSPGIGF